MPPAAPAAPARSLPTPSPGANTRPAMSPTARNGTKTPPQPPAATAAVVTAARRMQTASSLKSYLDAGLPPQGMTWTIRPSAGTAGRFPVSMVTEGHPPVGINVVLGNQYPPGTLAVAGSAHSPVKELRVVYPGSSRKPVFWQPLAPLGSDRGPAILNWLATIDIGWLWLYLLTYLPVLFILQALMKVA